MTKPIMSTDGLVEKRFEFPNGTVIRAYDYECGYEYQPRLQYRKDTSPNLVNLANYQVNGFLVVKLSDYVNIKKAIAEKERSKANVNATLAFTFKGYQLIQNVKEIKIYLQKIAYNANVHAPEDSVLIRYLAKELDETIVETTTQ